MERDVKPGVVRATETIIDLDRVEILSILRDVQDIPLREADTTEGVVRWFD